MKKISFVISLIIALLYFDAAVCAQEKIVGSEVQLNNKNTVSTWTLPTDIRTITMTQVNQQVIPEAPFKEDLVQNAEVIYRFRYKVTAKKNNGATVTNMPIQSITYTGPIKGCKFTNIDSTGVGYIDIDVRGAHNFTVYCRIANATVRSNVISKLPTVKAAYQKAFYCTGYNTALESDYYDTEVSAPGITDDKFSQQFLEATKLNGSGKADSGKYLHYNSSTKQFSYYQPVTATGTTPTVGKTIAVDPYYIPRAKPSGVWKRATVFINGIGNRVAEDGGGAIKGYRIDVYQGLGKAAMVGWKNGNRTVTLMSVN